MNQPTSAREAFILEALGDVAKLLDRVELLRSSIEAGRADLAKISVLLDRRLGTFESELSAITHQAKARVVEHIARRGVEVMKQSIEEQTHAMNESARLAFSAQVGPTLARLTKSLQQVIERADRPWELWLTHAATATASAATTWSLLTAFAIK